MTCLHLGVNCQNGEKWLDLDMFLDRPIRFADGSDRLGEKEKFKDALKF